MGLVAHLEHIVLAHVSKPSRCRLEVVEGVPHVPIRSEYERFQPVVLVGDLLFIKDKLETL